MEAPIKNWIIQEVARRMSELPDDKVAQVATFFVGEIARHCSESTWSGVDNAAEQRKKFASEISNRSTL